jgi:hypothetical protein
MPKLTKRGRGKSLVGWVYPNWGFQWAGSYYAKKQMDFGTIISSKRGEFTKKVRITIQEIPITERKGR